MNKKNNKLKHKKDGRINPHKFWLLFMTIILVAIIICTISFTYFFVISTNKLDANVSPQSDTNFLEIKKIEQSIQKTEDALSARQGGFTSSQNGVSVVH